MEILIKKLDERAKLPAYASEASVGIELYALDKVVLAPGERVSVATGIALALPVGYVGFIWCRHGNLADDPVKVTKGIIDSSFRDEVVVELTNTGTEERVYEAGDKVAQLLVEQVHRPRLIEAEDLSSPE